jgi:hypothetical protein
MQRAAMVTVQQRETAGVWLIIELTPGGQQSGMTARQETSGSTLLESTAKSWRARGMSRINEDEELHL